jgi:DnaK suppressor protein
MAHKPVRKAVPVAKKKPAKSAKTARLAKPAKQAKKPSKPAKPSPKSARKVSKPVAKKNASKPMSKSKPKTSPQKKPAAKHAPAPAKAKAKPAATPVPKPAAPKPVAKAPEPAPRPVAIKPLKGKDAVRAKILASRTKPAKPSAFTLDEVLAIAKTTAAKEPAPETQTQVPVIATKSGKVAPLPADALKPAAPSKVKAASLADILGFNPRAKSSHADNEEANIPEKFKRYYKLLIELRNHVTGQVDRHSEETLKRSAKEDSGDLSSYGTDGGTDSFDRDFALSLVANEQEALAEIEAAIQRIKNGTYGICEQTEKPIPKERLLAVPFTRYTAEAMKEVEKTRYRVRGQTGIFGEGEEGAKIDDGSDE